MNPGADSPPAACPDTRFRLSDLPLWAAFYLLCLVWWLAVWPFFFIRNFIPLMRSRTFFALGVLLVAIDQLTKQVMPGILDAHGGRITVLPGFLDLTLVTNKGAAFGLFQGQTTVFIVMAVLTVGIIIAYLSIVGEEERMVRCALVCIMAGAIGNLIDRVCLGHVIDFIFVHYGPYHWPVFNFADVVIDVGVGLILIDVVRDLCRPRDRVPAET